MVCLRGKHGSLVLLGKCSLIFRRLMKEIDKLGFACLFKMNVINYKFGFKGVHDFQVV